MKPIFCSFLLLLLPAFSQPPAAQTATQLQLAAPIGDHMVLQRDQACGVWGTAKAGTAITVSFAGQQARTQAGEDGAWKVQLDIPGANTSPQTMTLTAKADGQTDTRTVKDILIGDVWICSGQSNMRMTVDRCLNADEEKAKATFPQIRLFTVAMETATTPQTDCAGTWEICSPDTVGAFSGTGYFFGRDLHQALKIPIGLVNNSWGGKPVEAFTSPEKLTTVPTAQPLLEEWNEKQATYDEGKEKAAYEKAIAAWEAKVKEMRATAKTKGKKPGRLPRKPQRSSQPNRMPNHPSALFHKMVAPWTQTGITGAIWYQGESNRGRAAQYRELFPALIEDWRVQWKQPDLPFYWVQLANFQQAASEANQDSAWAELQEAQTLTLALPHTGMAIINDIGAANDIHPKNKQDAGHRLARWALAQHYHQDIDPISGPLYERHEIVGDALRVHFAHTGTGLKTRNGNPPGHFEIAGADKQYTWATATIDPSGKSVTVKSDAVSAPVALRYAWADNPTQANVVNSAGLPTSLFRTDHWKRSTAGRNTLASAALNPRVLRARNDRLKAMGWDVLFDGETTKGWRNPYDWGEVRVEQGEIHLSANKKFFLVTEKEYSDFHFKAEVKLPEGQANSGFMFRCHVEPNKVYGYQAEVDGSDRRWSGGLYDEGRRKWIWPSMKGKSQEAFLAHSETSLAHFATDKVKHALKRNEWNKYEITCIGPAIVIRVNGVETTRIRDEADTKGFLAIQHHGEKGAVYKFRNLMVRDLSKKK